LLKPVLGFTPIYNMSIFKVPKTVLNKMENLRRNFFNVNSSPALLDSVILSNSNDRWVSDLNGDGVFRVKDVRNLLDEFFLPRADVPTRWVKNIPIKVNIFAWRLALDRLPTRANLIQRIVVTESRSCPLCDAILEDTSHLFFNCSLARDISGYAGSGIDLFTYSCDELALIRRILFAGYDV
nr:RNA-directed DNA polymerase, eukaryota [Tanacetum cinerariifolium]